MKDAEKSIKALKEELAVQKMHHAAVKGLLLEMKVGAIVFFYC